MDRLRILFVAAFLLSVVLFAFAGGGEVRIASEGGIVSMEAHVALAASRSSSFVVEETASQPSPGEVVGERSQFSKKFYLGSGRYSLDSSVSPIHYRDAQSNWQDINNTLLSTVAPWNWLMNQDAYQVLIKNDLTAGQVLEYSSEGQYVRFQPMALQWTNDLDQISQISMPQVGVLSVVDNEIKWANGYGVGRDFSWVVDRGILRKLLTINSTLPTPPAFITAQPNPALELNFIFDPSSGLDIYIDGVLWPNNRPKRQTFSHIEFRVGAETLWVFRAPVYWDSSDSIEEVPPAWAVLKKSGNNLYVSVRVPYSWLQTAIYPVTIDPTIDKAVGASAQDAYETAAVDTPNLTGTYVFVNSHTILANQYWGGTLFNGNGWPALGDTIDVAYLTIRSTSGSYDDVRAYLQADDTASPGNFTTTDADITGRTLTTAASPWIASALGTSDVNSPSIVNVTQELVDSYTVTAIAIIWKPYSDGVNNQALRFYSRDGSSTIQARLHIEYTAGGVPSLANTPSSKAFGTVDPSSTYYAYGSAPSNPVQDAECTFTITNDGTISINITIKATNFTGGVGWTLTSGSPGSNTVRLTAYKSGDNPASGVVLTTGEQAFVSALAASGTKKWDFKFETGTFTDGDAKTSTITLTATAS